MCSVEGDEELGPIKTPKAEESAKVRNCVKCCNPGILITRINDSFCKTCFQVYVVHKFRAAIGKSHLIRDGERVLVAFSGGPNSAALIHMIQDGLGLKVHKKLRFIPTLIHVDQTSVLPLEESDRQAVQAKVGQLMADSGFPAFMTRLDVGLTLESSPASTSSLPADQLYWPVDTLGPRGDLGPKMQDRLTSVVQGLTSISSREDFILNLRNQLLVSIARHMGISKVLTAECSTRLGVRILSDVAQGRGSQVALNTTFADARNEDVQFVRPVRDLNVKDLAMYNNLFHVSSVFIPTLTTKGEVGASIERLTETFVTGLQADYQSTVPNIVKTSEKLGLPNFSATKCVYCKSPLDTSAGSPALGTASALNAVQFSISLSQNQVQQRSGSAKTEGQGCSSQDTCCGEGDGSCHSKIEKGIQLNDIMDHLCYGCQLSIRNFTGDSVTLPLFMKKEAEFATQRIKMRDEIADFLLEDDDDS